MPKEPKISARKNRAGERPITNDQREKIKKAVKDASRMADRVNSGMSKIWKQSGTPRKRRKKRKKAWRNNAHFVKWLGDGALTNAQIRRTRRRIRKLKDWLDNRRLRFIIIQHQSGDRSWACDQENQTVTLAYSVIPGPPLRIRLCPEWFNVDAKRRACTIIHELVHEMAKVHPIGRTGPVKTREQAIDLAKSHPRRARRSPENYEHLFGEYY